jgi:hypothetical protein
MWRSCLNSCGAYIIGNRLQAEAQLPAQCSVSARPTFVIELQPSDGKRLHAKMHTCAPLGERGVW